MYIKIKTIKQTLLILACIFFAGFNYLNFVKAENTAAIDSDKDGLTDTEEQLYATDANNTDTDGDGYSDGVEIKSGYDPLKAGPEDKIATLPTNSKDNPNTEESEPSTSLTAKFTQEFSSYLASKEGQSISAEDVRLFTDNLLAETSTQITADTLPEIDRSKISILSQAYPLLSETEKKQQIQIDTVEYLTQVSYLLTSNTPKTITTTEDWKSFQDDFTNKLTDPTSPENSIYFSDMGSRLELFSVQLEALEVPETMLDLHIKFSRIIQGVLSIRDLPKAKGSNDPLGNMVILSRARDLSLIFADFLDKDLSIYLQQNKTE